MCFAFDRKNGYLTKKREDGLEFHITRLSVLIPLLVSAAVFFVEIYNNFDNGGQRRLPDDMEIKTGSAGLTMMITIFFAFFYVLFSFKVRLWNQILLVVMQLVYMVVIFKYGISEKIVRYGNSIKNVVSY